MIEKNCFIDIETTGTNSEIHAIHQIAGIIEIAGNRVEHFDIKVNPGARRIEKEALEIAGVTEETIKAYPSSTDGHLALKKILDGYVNQYDKKDKFNFIGYNANFDDRFLRVFWGWRDSYYGSYFRWPPLDVANLAGIMLRSKRNELADFKLMTVAKYLGIEVEEEKLHDAIYDIKITMDLFHLLNSNIQELFKDKSKQ